MRKNLKSLRLLFALLAVFGLIAAACGDDDGDDTGSGDDGTEQTDGGDGGDGDGEASDISVGMVYDIGGRGDQSFNDAAYRGLTQAADEFGIEVDDLEPSAGGENREELLRLLAEQGYDLVIGVGFAFADAVTAVSEEFPDTEFAIIDSVVEADNVASMVFAEEQGSFLVGAAAALQSESGQIGFIGGVENDLIAKFEAGYVAGAQAVNPDIQVEVSYISQPPDFSGFNDPARAREIAASMYQGGADVIYHAAGGSGNGLFEAAADAGEPGEVWAIGVDSDQYEIVGEPLNQYILTSMLKRVDNAVYQIIERYVGGEDISGVQEFDLESEGVGYSTSGDFLGDITGDLDAFAEQITAGDIEVPTAP
ncbi:BMP family lipoprotein [Actinomarinicola tropica]|uniref:BMP family lipoprotein n=1 Tax=Actinomarinicola tropica TaxID=2789776 RepID=UPI001E2C198F|nr:BMP family ABC transporter substrate-binding protein [Actinomarinicola tropica]